jgi:pyruvate,orthophosphate dikinase
MVSPDEFPPAERSPVTGTVLDECSGQPAVMTLSPDTERDGKLLGGKAVSLVSLLRLGLRVPPAFVLTTALCARFLDDGKALDRCWDDVQAELADLERATGRRFGAEPGLLVSVRSGAPASLPGMMQSVLGVGAGTPDLAAERLRQAITDVFESCRGARFDAFRRAGLAAAGVRTAVILQAMVFGDADERSGTGVYFTRDPVTGAAAPFGEWLPVAQGPRLVSGDADPLPLAALAEEHPAVHTGLVAAGERAEREFGYPCEFEFTVERGVLYFLQVRRALPSPSAALLWDGGGPMPGAAAASGVAPAPGRGVVGDAAASGTPACPGVATGRVVATLGDTRRLVAVGVPVILAREHTSPADVEGFALAAGVLTEVGGATSHAAILSRQLGVPCVVGCSRGTIDRLLGHDVVLDGGTGLIHLSDVDAATDAEGPGDPTLIAEGHAAPEAVTERPGDAALYDGSGEFWALHHARLLSRVDATALSRMGGLDDASAGAVLAGLAERGLLVGERGDLRLTDVGRIRADALLAARRPRDASPAIACYHARFGPLNAQLKEMLTQAQLDPAFTGERLATPLGLLRAHAVAMLAELAAHCPHLAAYGPPFELACAKVADGDTRYLTGFGIGSCHEIWMALHADVLTTLGLERAEDDW